MKFIVKSEHTGRHYLYNEENPEHKLLLETLRKDSTAWTVREFQESSSLQDIWEIYTREILK